MKDEAAFKAEQDNLRLPETLEESHEVIKKLFAEVHHLRGKLYGSSKDRAKAYEGPGLFDGELEEAVAEKAEALDAAQKLVDAEAAKRRERARKPSNRPSRYLYSGLREETTTVYPEGIDIEQYDIIGQDVTRTLRTRPAELWVECVIRPILRRKGEKDALNPEIVQAPAPRPVLGGNHVGADLLAQLVVNKYWYHLPEYRQIRMFAENGLTLPRSTVNNWIHGVAQVLYPLYLSQCAVENSRQAQTGVPQRLCVAVPGRGPVKPRHILLLL